MAEIAAALAQHKAQGGIETARCVQGRKRLLENEVYSHAESFLRSGSLTVNDGKCYRVLIAGSTSQPFQDPDPAGHVIAVHDYGIEFFRDQNLAGFFGLLTDFDLDRQFFERRA